MLSLATGNLLAQVGLFAQESLPIVDDRDGGLVLIVVGLLGVALAALVLGGLYFWATGQTARDRFAKQHGPVDSANVRGAGHVDPATTMPTPAAAAVAPLFGNAAAQLTLFEAGAAHDDDGFAAEFEPAGERDLAADRLGQPDVSGLTIPRRVVTDAPPPEEDAMWAPPEPLTNKPSPTEESAFDVEPFGRAERVDVAAIPFDLPAQPVTAPPVPLELESEDPVGLPVPLDGVDMPDDIPRGSDEPDTMAPEIPAW